MAARFQTWARANPLLVLALAAVAGILFMEAGWVPWGGMGSVILAAVAALLLLTVLRGGGAWWLASGCALVFAFIHGTRLDETFRHPLRQHLQAAADAAANARDPHQPQQAVLRGTLLPEFDLKDEDRAHALCTTQEIRLSGAATFPQPATLLVRLPPGVRFPGAGMYELRGRLLLPRPAANPGGFDGREHALRLGRVARFEADGLRRISPAGRGQSLACAFLQTAEECRQWISARLTQDLEDDPETTAVIRAMALGVAAEASDEIEDAFRDSGTLHVFAVSGLHVALLGLIALTFLRQLRTPHGVSLGLMIAIVFAYAFITGWRPSAARAAFMVAVFLGGTLADRTSSLQNSLGAAALLLLGADTHALFMPGFQLSFGVLWASALGSAPLLRRLRPLTQLDPFLPPQLASGRQRASAWFRRWLVTTVSVSLAAWLGSLPFILMHFHAVTPVAVLANCVLVPLSFFCLGATCLSLCAAVVHASGVQILFNNLNWFLAKAMILSAAWFAHLPGANFHFDAARPSAKDAPAVWRMLRLPHGAAAHHLSLGSAHWLLDVGDALTFRHVLRPALRTSGVRSLQGVILSHNDADHLGALSQLADFCGMPPLYASAQEPGPLGAKRSALRQLLEAHPASLRKLSPEQTLSLSSPAARFKAEAQVLHPAGPLPSAAADDRAMVLMLHLGPWRVLWMSDAGWEAEKALCAGTANLRCDVLIRSQHEEDLAISEEFLLKAAPRAILCGSDARHAATRLPPTLLKFAQRQNIPLLDTWSDGSLEIQFGHDALHILPRHSGHAPVHLTPAGWQDNEAAK